jgi:tetratricopeptide (TPR) repeat protein
MAHLSDGEVKKIQKAVFDLIQNGQLEDGANVVQTLLEHDPNDAISLNFLGIIHLELQNFHLAYQYFRRALQEKQNLAPVWVNFGLAAHELGRNQEALSSYLKSAEIDTDYVKAYVNAAALFIEEARWDEAEKCCNIALEIDKDSDLAKKNLAHIHLAKHNWAKGWEYWDLSLGCKYRKEWVYGDEKRWDGTKNQAVIVYGEQGLGDEINYASCIPDAIKDCKKVIIDCDPKLEKLFRRSFPNATVHGTRRDSSPGWLADARIDARVAISSLPRFYRNADSDFPGTPYLKADPELVKMWKGMFADWKKPVYGLCLHGGSKLTGAAWRKLEPEDFSPLFATGASFVSLDYKGHLKHPKIKEFPWATQVSDYDLTASLIASLDGVIGVNTTAIHCANGLGVPTHILVPAKKQWRYEPCKDGSYVWCKTATMYHQKEGEGWREVVKRVKL